MMMEAAARLQTPPPLKAMAVKTRTYYSNTAVVSREDWSRCIVCCQREAVGRAMETMQDWVW